MHFALSFVLRALHCKTAGAEPRVYFGSFLREPLRPVRKELEYCIDPLSRRDESMTSNSFMEDQMI